MKNFFFTKEIEGKKIPNLQTKSYQAWFELFQASWKHVFMKRFSLQKLLYAQNQWFLMVFDRFLHEWCENPEKMCLMVEFSIINILFMENMSSTNSTCNGLLWILANPNFARFEVRAYLAFFRIFGFYENPKDFQNGEKVT